jgi:hypothetical protein
VEEWLEGFCCVEIAEVLIWEHKQLYKLSKKIFGSLLLFLQRRLGPRQELWTGSPSAQQSSLHAELSLCHSDATSESVCNHPPIEEPDSRLAH